MLIRRSLAALLAVFLVLTGVWPGGAEETSADHFVLAGYDDTAMRDWATNHFFEQMREWTGVSFTFQQTRDEKSWIQFKQDLLNGTGDMPDALFKAALTGAECIELREKGVLIDLKPYLEEHAPYVWALLKENPEAEAAVTLPDGSIAALPYFNSLPAQNYVWINQKWLDTLRLPMPETAEELVNVLTAFRDRDPNRNGRQDEIPLGFLGPFDLKFLAHAFGLIANDYNIFAENGQVRFMPLEENYRLFVTWCRDLYDAELLDKNGFKLVDSMRRVRDEKATATYGAILTTTPSNLFSVSWADDYTVMPPLRYEGTQAYRDFFGPVTRGTFAVTSACASPERMLEWVDRLYTEQGAVLYSAGLENVDYLVDGDGTWRLTDYASHNGSAFMAEAIMTGGAMGPGIGAEEFMTRYSGQSEGYRRSFEKQMELRGVCRMPFPYVTLNREQQEEITALQNEIGAYVDLSLARWVLGEEEISDESFAAFEATLNEKGLPAFLAFWQARLNEQTKGDQQP